MNGILFVKNMTDSRKKQQTRSKPNTNQLAPCYCSSNRDEMSSCKSNDVVATFQISVDEARRLATEDVVDVRIAHSLT